MSRYLLLLIVNLPFIFLAILSVTTNYKLGKISRRKFIWRVIFWLLILVGLASAEGIYEWLYSKDLTETEPLSLFDVVQLTAIVFAFYTINRMRDSISKLKESVSSLHSAAAIVLSSSARDKH